MLYREKRPALLQLFPESRDASPVGARARRSIKFHAQAVSFAAIRQNAKG
jgi:hypothetical protein